MNVYIVGMVSKGGTLSAVEIRANLRNFAAAEKELKAYGHLVYSPPWHNPDGDFEPSTTRQGWQWYMREDIKALMEADAIYLIPGWEGSEGSEMEVGLARRLGMSEFGPGRLEINPS